MGRPEVGRPEVDDPWWADARQESWFCQNENQCLVFFKLFRTSRIPIGFCAKPHQFDQKWLRLMDEKMYHFRCCFSKHRGHPPAPPKGSMLCEGTPCRLDKTSHRLQVRHPPPVGWTKQRASLASDIFNVLPTLNLWGVRGGGGKPQRGERRAVQIFVHQPLRMLQNMSHSRPVARF